MCLRAIKTKHYSCSAYISSVSWAITLTYTSNGLSSFQNLRRKGGKFDHRPERPKVLLRTPLPLTPLVWLHHCRAHCSSTSTTCWRRSSARPSAVVSCRPPSSTCSTSSTTWHCTTPSSTHTSRTRGNPTGPGSAPLYDTSSAGLMPTEARGNHLPEAPYLRETKTYPNCT